MGSDDTLIKFGIYYAFAVITSIVLIVISGLAITDHNKINSWDSCRCYFNDTVKYDPHYSYYSSVEIEAISKCGDDEKGFEVKVYWPPGRKWYDRQTPSQVKDYVADLKVLGESECFVNQKTKDAVTENIIGYGWYIFYLILGLLALILPVIILVVVVYLC